MRSSFSSSSLSCCLLPLGRCTCFAYVINTLMFSLFHLFSCSQPRLGCLVLSSHSSMWFFFKAMVPKVTPGPLGGPQVSFRAAGHRHEGPAGDARAAVPVGQRAAERADEAAQQRAQPG